MASNMSTSGNFRQVTVMKNSTPVTSYRNSRGTGSTKNDVVHVNPFKTGSLGNSSFSPQKAGLHKSSNDSRLPKPPKAPEKPLMPYMRYSRKVWDQVKTSNPELKLWEIGKIIGSKWKVLPESERQSYSDEYESEKSDYERSLKSYHSSSAYQAYLSAKTRNAAPTPNDETNSKVDRRVDIQPADDENDYDESINEKNMSHMRFIRNHRLINEIFSDTCVPDVRTIVTSQRLSVLRKQVQSLTMHQEKLENELNQIEEKFKLKKRKFLCYGDDFQVELKKVKSSAPKLDEKTFATMVEKQKEALRKEAEERRLKAFPFDCGSFGRQNFEQLSNFTNSEATPQ